MKLLEVKNLVVEFPHRRGTLRALDDISFDIAPGEILGVVGESGAGKSITGASIIGLLEPPGRIASGQIKAWAQSLEYLRKYETQFPTGQWIKDVSMLIGKVNFFSGDFKASAAQFEKIRNIPELRDEVLPLLGEAYEKSDQGAEAVKVLLDYLKGGYGSTERINAALRLATLYLSVDQPEKGIEIIDKIKCRVIILFQQIADTDRKSVV